MTTIKEIEKAIAQLPPQKFSILRSWIDRFETARWDKQLVRDVKTGKLESVARKVRESYKKGKCKELRGILQILLFGTFIIIFLNAPRN